jgi:hypothetical protein
MSSENGWARTMAGPDIDKLTEDLAAVIEKERHEAIVYSLLTVLCLMVASMQVGCRSVYRFHCTSVPFPAGVVIDEQMMGETPCDVAVPKDSDWIRDGRIEFTFCLPDGPEKTHTVNLHNLKPSNPMAEAISAPMMLTGVALLLSSGDHGQDEKEEIGRPWTKDEKEKHRNNLNMALVGFGVAGAGGGVYHLLGGNDDSLNGYKIHVDFNEPTQSVGP